jgi:hypothetical protein
MPSFGLIIGPPIWFGYGLFGIVVLRLLRQPITIVTVTAFAAGGAAAFTFGSMLMFLAAFAGFDWSSGTATIVGLSGLLAGTIYGSGVSVVLVRLFIDESKESWVWWNGRRRAYNIGLVVAGISAFLAMNAVVYFCNGNRSGNHLFDPGVILFLGMPYLLAMWAANAAYCGGPILESIVPAQRVPAYRRIVYSAGFAFSVVLPFSIPGLMTLFCS